MSFAKFEELLEIKTNHFTKQLKHSDLTDDMQSHQIFSKKCVDNLQFHACVKNLYFKYFGKIYSKISGLSLC